MPWAYARRALAKEWGCKPWEVDAAPAYEIEAELEIRRVEAEVAAGKARMQAQGMGP